MGDTDHSMARERPRLSLKLRLRPPPLFSTTLSDIRLSTTPATTWPTTPTTTPLSTPEATTSLLTTTLDTGPSMARERPRLSLKLRLRLTPLFSTTLSDIRLSTTSDTGPSMARERPRLRLNQLWFTDRMVSTT